MNEDNFSLNRRDFLKAGAAVLGGTLIEPSAYATEATCPKVYFCKDISPENLLLIYDKVSDGITGKVAIKLHTGEPGAPYLPPRTLAQALQAHIPQSTIVECNVLYPSPRQKTESHRKLLKENGWTFCPVDIMDADGDTPLPIPGADEFFDVT